MEGINIVGTNSRGRGSGALELFMPSRRWLMLEVGRYIWGKSRKGGGPSQRRSPRLSYARHVQGRVWQSGWNELGGEREEARPRDNGPGKVGLVDH